MNNFNLYLNISGFLKDLSEDDSLKFKHCFDETQNDSVLKAMGWDSLENSPHDENELSAEHIKNIENATGVKLPSTLQLYISVLRGPILEN